MTSGETQSCCTAKEPLRWERRCAPPKGHTSAPPPRWQPRHWAASWRNSSRRLSGHGLRSPSRGRGERKSRAAPGQWQFLNLHLETSARLCKRMSHSWLGKVSSRPREGAWVPRPPGNLGRPEGGARAAPRSPRALALALARPPASRLPQSPGGRPVPGSRRRPIPASPPRARRRRRRLRPSPSGPRAPAAPSRVAGARAAGGAAVKMVRAGPRAAPAAAGTD